MVCAAQRGVGDECVHWLQRMHPSGEEVPALQFLWQVVWASGLKAVDEADENQDPCKGSSYSHHDLPPSHGEPEDQRRQKEETNDQVEHCEPAVLGGALPKGLGHADGQACARDGVPQEDTKDVEEEMAESNLK